MVFRGSSIEGGSGMKAVEWVRRVRQERDRLLEEAEEAVYRAEGIAATNRSVAEVLTALLEEDAGEGEGEGDVGV